MPMEVIKYSADVLGWQRKPGPVRVWRVVEGKKTEDGKTLRFSIQEIPEDRQIDALNLMLDVFTRDEPICRSHGVCDNPEALEDFRKLWSFSLGQGIVVGAFLHEENNPKPKLAGVNMTLIHSDVTHEGFTSGIDFTCETTLLVFDALKQLDNEKDTKKTYNVDEYISAMGLCVDPQFRGQGLGNELLLARKEMAKAYGIKATSTMFTGPASQHIATKVGFELLVERDYASFRKEDGTEYFPGIQAKSCKLMGMRL